MPKVLIIEDDREIADVVAMNLRDAGLEAEHAYTGPTGLEAARSEGYDALILDVMLPGMDGIAVCRALRGEGSPVPILMLTAKAEEVDRILGLELGADDYMTKPFSVRELVARVKALLRRANGGTAPQKGPEKSGGRIVIGNLMIDEVMRKVALRGESLDLTVKEFELLRLFMKNPGRAYSRADLLALIWDYGFEGYEHTVNTHINRLRNKIEKDASRPEYLKTVWGVGYRFCEPGELQ